jgi:hypothetical protein
MRGVLRWQAPIWEKMHVVDFMVVDSFSKAGPAPRCRAFRCLDA